jgi:SHS2 domain-containing protein
LIKPYELIEHTADVGIRVKAQDLKSLFINSALAMFDIIAEKKPGKNARPIKISLKDDAANIEELFINWLNDLLSLSAAKGLIFSDFKIDKLDKNTVKADLTGYPFDNYRINAEIKAATYHQLKLEKADAGWIAEVIFDV